MRATETLLRIVASLFALVTASRMGGAAELLLPRRVWRAVLFVLRPAEAAVRRLVLIAARGMAPATLRPRAANFAAITCAAVPREPVFRLIDPLRDPMRASLDAGTVWDGEPFGDEAELADLLADDPEQPISAARLHLRMRALRQALVDLDRQARRLARWIARRNALLAASRPTRLSLMRPGLPPGWRGRGRQEIDLVLRECHGLAHDLIHAPDTS